MRIIIVLLFLSLSLFAKSGKNFVDVENVIRILNILQNKESNISIYDYNPFCKNIKNGASSSLKEFKKPKKNIKLIIKAILNNKVYINNRWYKVGDRVGSYIVYKILDNAVLFKHGSKIIKKSLIKEGL